MSTQFQYFVLIFVFGLTLGCDGEPKPIAQTVQGEVAAGQEIRPDAWPPQRELEERDFEIIRFVLAQANESEVDVSPADGVNFLTSTPRDYWGTTGLWEELPASFHASLDLRGKRYRPAGEACLKGGYVIENESKARATMHWITIKKWISPTEVEVETGSWGGPLDAVGATTVYEKQDGSWKTKRVINSWLS